MNKTKSLAALLLTLLVCLSGLTQVVYSRVNSPSEYDIKAALIYKLIPFIKWPDGEKRTKLTIGVVGRNPFGTTLNILSRRKIGSFSLNISYFNSIKKIDRISQCQILFIAEENEDRLQRILKEVAGMPILTIGDSEGFVDKGGIIGFTEKDKHIAFEINRGAARKSKLGIRSQLLRLAVRVLSEGDENRRAAE